MNANGTYSGLELGAVNGVYNGVNSGVGHGVTSNEIKPLNIPLLDLFPGAAAAYSLRKLRTNYNGPAIRVRRSSDNAEQDIGFDVNGNFNEIQLRGFLGTSDGFVTVFYDQSGNGRNASQLSQTSQPRIASIGTIDRQGIRPTMVFDGTNDFLSGNAAASVISGEDKPFSVLSVTSSSSTSGNRELYIFASDTGNDFPMIFPLAQSGTQYRVYIRQTSSSIPTINSLFSTVNLNIQYLLFNISSGLGYTFYRNGISLISESYNTGDISVTTATIGARTTLATTNFYSGNVQEIIYWPNEQSSNRAGIEQNINSYYKIY
jgi:hypothetical protein